MTDLVHVKGLADLQKFLNALPAEIEAKLMRGALREAAKVVLEEAKRQAPKESGEMAEGLAISTSSKRGTVMAKIKAKGKHGFLAPFIEFGTKPHFIKVREEDRPTNRPGRFRRGQPVSMRTLNRNALKIGQSFVGAVHHPGTKPRPFMRPALDAKAGAAVMAAGNYLKKRLASRSKTGFGLDTSGITIEENDNED